MGVEALYASDVELTPGGLVFAVRPPCGGCGWRGVLRPTRRVRLAAFGGGLDGARLRYAPPRVDCRDCGVTVEAVPWAGHDRRFTRGFLRTRFYLDTDLRA